MKKLLWLVLAALALCAPAGASVRDVEAALEACRGEEGLLPDTPGGGYSSEVLMFDMELRLLRDDEEAFGRLYGLMRKHFQSPLMLLYRRLDPSLRPVACENSVAVDLQMCRVLMGASRKWGAPEYRELALKMARRILRFNVYHDVLVNSASWKERRSGFHTVYEPSHILDLCGVDVQALQLLQSEMPEWEPVAQRCLGILLAGSGTDTMRLRYDVEKRRYADSDGDLAESLRIIASLVDGGLVPLRPMARLLDRQRLEPRFLSNGAGASLAAAALGAYVMERTGHVIQSQQAFVFLEEYFGSDGGLLGLRGEPPSLRDNLLYLIIRHVLTPKRPGA